VKQARTRLSFLAMCGLITVIAVACGRASQDEIYEALNITPTPTLSDQQIADNTAIAIAEEETRTAAQAALSSPGAEGGSVDLAAAGNPVMGRTSFLQRCQSCHRPGGAGPAPELSGPNNPAVALSDQEIVDLLRTGEGHAAPPGPFSEVDLRQQQLIDILAFIRGQSE